MIHSADERTVAEQWTSEMQLGETNPTGDASHRGRFAHSGRSAKQSHQSGRLAKQSHGGSTHAPSGLKICKTNSL
jgi:hypothetical protein